MDKCYLTAHSIKQTPVLCWQQGKAKNQDGLFTCSASKRRYQSILEVGSKVGTQKQNWLKAAYQAFWFLNPLLDTKRLRSVFFFPSSISAMEDARHSWRLKNSIKNTRIKGTYANGMTKFPSFFPTRLPAHCSQDLTTQAGDRTSLTKFPKQSTR